MKTGVRLLWLVLPFLGCVLLAGGCSVLLGGGGKAGIGHSSESKFFFFHEADGNMIGKSSADLHVDPVIMSLIGDIGGNDEPEAETDGPVTGE